jgi:dTDP-glucose pyrophosphorylase
MNEQIARHLIHEQTGVREALSRLDSLPGDSVLFVVDDSNRLISSLTDGDIRRGLIRGLDMSTPLREYTQPGVRFLKHDDKLVDKLRELREQNYRIIPIVDNEQRILDIVNFRLQRSYLPMEAIIMAGGLGSRLRPLTNDTPKPLLEVGGRAILEHNIRRLASYGVKKVTISVRYLGQQIVDHFGDGSSFNMDISYLWEDEPRGTIGAVSELEDFSTERVLIMNSDLLTTVNLEEMYAETVEKSADMMVATVPYEVKIPYGVLETEGDLITALREKPTYTYYSNAGIYIVGADHLRGIPKTGPYTAPDLMEKLYTGSHRVAHFPIIDYWLDIGKPEDFEKAQRDIEHLKL